MPLTVIVVGAGIGGLATAIALRRAQHRVIVLERRAENAVNRYAVIIPPNATRILVELGMDLAKLRGCQQSGIDIFKGDADPVEYLKTEEMPTNKDEPLLAVHRQDYYMALKELAVSAQGVGPPAELRFDSQVVSYDADNASVTLASGDALVADLVVAADGALSKAHKWVIGEERRAQFTGFSNIRFLLPTSRMLAQPGMEDFVKKADGKSCIYIDSERNLLMQYPCRDGEFQNFGVYHQEGANGETSGVQDNRAIAQERVRNMHSTIKSLAGLPEESEMYLWQIVERDPLPKFHKGKLVICGDAAHPMRTTLGQGGATTVEDAGVLGVVLQHADNSSDLAARLQLWEDLRRPRASSLQLMSRTSPESDGWIHLEDKKKAEVFFPNGDLPMTRAEIFDYAHKYDALAEARRSLGSKL